MRSGVAVPVAVVDGAAARVAAVSVAAVVAAVVAVVAVAVVEVSLTAVVPVETAMTSFGDAEFIVTGRAAPIIMAVGDRTAGIRVGVAVPPLCVRGVVGVDPPVESDAPGDRGRVVPTSDAIAMLMRAAKTRASAGILLCVKASSGVLL